MCQIDQAYNWVGGLVIRPDEGQNHEKWLAPSCKSSTTGLLATLVNDLGQGHDHIQASKYLKKHKNCKNITIFR